MRSARGSRAGLILRSIAALALRYVSKDEAGHLTMRVRVSKHGLRVPSLRPMASSGMTAEVICGEAAR
jgi:hypothetical protein